MAIRALLRNLLVLELVGGVLLGAVVLSGRRVPLLPRDASPRGVLPAAAVLAIVLTIAGRARRGRR